MGSECSVRPVLKLTRGVGWGWRLGLGVALVLGVGSQLGMAIAPWVMLPAWAETRVSQRAATIPTVSLRQLPAEVKQVIQRIRQGGPFPYRKDGTVFGNRERQLPNAPRGYYKEYTVPTPGAKNRGARRLVVGGNNELYYYTGNHYRSFVKVKL